MKTITIANRAKVDTDTIVWHNRGALEYPVVEPALITSAHAHDVTIRTLDGTQQRLDPKQLFASIDEAVTARRAQIADFVKRANTAIDAASEKAYKINLDKLYT